MFCHGPKLPAEGCLLLKGLGSSVPSLVSWFISVSLSQTGVLWEEGSSGEELPPTNWPVGEFKGVFS